MKFQYVLCPDGIIASLKGAFAGRRHDAGIFRESLLYNELEHVAVFGEYGLMQSLLEKLKSLS